MGQKVQPNGMRLGVIREHNAKWYAGNQSYSTNLVQDLKIREYLEAKLKSAAVSEISIERPAQNVNVTIHTARPGVVIGQKGADIEKLRQQTASLMKIHPNNVKLNIEEIRKPELDAKLVAESIANQLERRIMFRRAMKRAVSNAMRLGALGIKVSVSGRLNGAEIARTEWYREGRVPLHTLRADIDYATARGNTTYGVIGVKVWIYKGEVFDLEQKQASSSQKNGKKK